MWPFKKNKTASALPAQVSSILCIPGPWTDDLALKLAIVQATDGAYIAAGGILMHVESKRHFILEVCERDDRMRESFAIAGSVTAVSDPFLEEIDRHNLVAYISASSGNPTDAAHIAFAATALLNAGGIGVKIETAGKAFERNVWLDLTDNFREYDLYKMFVIDSITEEDGTTFSCGMHNLGMKDTIVSGLPFQEAVELISIFGYYQLMDKPMIVANQTFSPAPDSAVYRITEELHPAYRDVEQLGNPFGVWRLTKQ